MSLSSERMMKLMAYTDGELDPAEQAEVERWLSADVDARRFVADLGHLGDHVRSAHAASPIAAKAAAFDVADAVMARLGAVSPERAPAPEPVVSSQLPSQVVLQVSSQVGHVRDVESDVTSIAAARQRRARTVKIGALVGGALALAAALALVVRGPKEAPMAAGPQPVETKPGAVAVGTGGAGAPGVSGGGPGVEIGAVESEGHSVSVFYLPGANEVSTSVVVWIDETGEK